MDVYLGDLSVEEIEKRVGIDFPKELKDYMGTRKQDIASNIKKGEWHCFGIPFVLLCGDIETATEIRKHLKCFPSEFKEPLQIKCFSSDFKEPLQISLISHKLL